MEATKTTPKALIIGACILGGLCALALIGLVILLCIRFQAQPLMLPEETQAPAFQTESPTEEETAEPYTPRLNLPLSPYVPEDFILEGDYMACTAGAYQLGVDVSSWQKKIDWQQVKAAGMEFAMLRFAWRGNTEGGIHEDDNARANYENAKEAGLAIGGYFFSQAISEEEAVEEAEFLLEMIEDWQIDMPIVFDWERSANRTAGTDPQTVTDCAKAFCQRIEEAGYGAMVYFNIRQAYGEIYLEELQDYGFWLAQYNDQMTFLYQVDMWQYTSTGSVPGIGTNVDINLYFLPEE